MVNKKSLANLKRGNSKNVGRKLGSGGPTFRDLILAYGETEPTRELASAAGITPELLRDLGLKRPTWKLLVVARAYRDTGNAAILKELLERVEGKITQPFGEDPAMPFGKISIFEYGTLDDNDAVPSPRANGHGKA